MKKLGILNRDIATVLSKLGHTDKIIIADCGLPIPEDVQCIDVSLKLGLPRFYDVLKAVVNDMEVEAVTLASEIKEKNQPLYRELMYTFHKTPINYVTHDQLKDEIHDVKAVIRTGEATPYANIILQAGVIF